MDALLPQDERRDADGEIAWSWSPDAARRWDQVCWRWSAGDRGYQARHSGESVCAGNAGCSGWICG